MGNPLMDRLKKRTGQNKAASKSAKGAKGRAVKTPESPVESAEETDAPTQTAKSATKGGKKLTALERMKAGKNKSGKSTKISAKTTPKNTDDSGSDSPDVGINPPKNKRKTKAADKPAASADAPPSATPLASRGSGSTLYIGCYPVQGSLTSPTSLHALLEDVKATVCEANDVTHWDFLEFGKGSAALAQALDAKLTEEGMPSVLYAEPFSSESRAVEQILLKHYDIVIRGTR